MPVESSTPFKSQKYVMKLNDAHNVFHNISNDLYNNYQAGNIDTARSGLGTFQLAGDCLHGIVDQCK